MTDEVAVKITLPAIYSEVVEMKENFAEVRALLEQHIALESQRSEGVEQRLENHGTRLGDQGTQIASIEGRVTQNESDIRLLKEAQTKREAARAPWWAYPAVILAALSTITLLANFVRSIPFAQ